MIHRESLPELLAKRIHIVGLAGSEGTAVARFLWKAGARDLTLHDVSEGDALRNAFSRSHVGLPRKQRDALWAELEALPVPRHLGEEYLRDIESAEVVFAGQAWYLYERNRVRLEPMIEAGVPLLGLMDLYFGLAPARILAVTGSNGKSTSSRLIEHLLRAADLRVWYAGNERRSVQVLDRLDEMSPEDWLVLEVSNRHLRGLRLPSGAGADVAVVTNVLPNHLDEHGGTMEAYTAVKRRLVDAQPAHGVAVLNADDPRTRGFADHAPGAVLTFSRGQEPTEAGAWLEEGQIRVRLFADWPIEALGPVSNARLPGDHNESNILAAVLAARAAGAPVETIAAALPRFRGLRHRIQFVWGADGVSYYDDLNATTPLATVAALRALRESIVLIIGGDDKGLALEELVAEIGARVRRLVVLPGPGGARIAEAVAAAKATTGHGPVIDYFEELEPAIRSVVAEAKAPEKVLLSPACPYFFRRFYIDGAAERGFRALLRAATAADNASSESAS